MGKRTRRPLHVCEMCGLPFRVRGTHIGRWCSRACTRAFHTPGLRLRRHSEATPSGCVVWTGHTDDWGYGVMKFEGKVNKTHRITWIIRNGPIPPGMYVCHTCDNPPCINPEHLWLGTSSDNARDREAKRRGRYSKFWEVAA